MGTTKKVNNNLQSIHKATSDLRNFALDGWQKKILIHKGNTAIRCSRQSGKSTIVSIKARSLAYDYPGSTTLIMSPSLRQSSLLYEKVRAMLELDNILQHSETTVLPLPEAELNSLLQSIIPAIKGGKN